MRDALKLSLHCDEELYNIEICANLDHCSLWRWHFFYARRMQDCLA